MKIILSRKGFDSTAGGYPSPILDAKELISFPIPEKLEKVSSDYYHISGNSYADHKTSQGITFLELLSQLLPPKNQNLKREKEKIPLSQALCHYDPQIFDPTTNNEASSYTGLFGQCGKPLGHLVSNSNKVGEDDLFLFFGWFRDTIRNQNGEYSYVSGSDKHVIWGWLEVKEVIDVNSDKTQDAFLRNHPHYYLEEHKHNNIFVGKDKLSFNPNLPGAGIFQYDKTLVLTKQGMTRSKWDLPIYFKGRISCHTPASFKTDYFQSCGRGQEFVVEADDRIFTWVKNLFNKETIKRYQ